MQETRKPVRLSDGAVQVAVTLATEPQNAGKSLRLYIEGKGCDGFVYGVSFDYPSAEDIHFSHDTIDLVVDPETLVYVEGSHIEWVDDERGRGFLVENPNHTKFRGKFFKRSNYQDWLATRRAAIENL